jgi:hypothetical protein
VVQDDREDNQQAMPEKKESVLLFELSYNAFNGKTKTNEKL